MGKNICTTIFWKDKTEAFGIVKPFYYPVLHSRGPFIIAQFWAYLLCSTPPIMMGVFSDQ
jgi:hypothetical protein